jgi:hypothetical protein
VRWWWYYWYWGGKQAGRQLHCRRHPPHPSPVGSVHALRQSIQYRARMQQQHDDGRTDLWHRAALALLCMHACIARAAPVRRQRCRPARIRRRSPSWCIGAGAGGGRCRSTSTDGCSHPMQTPPRQAPLARVRALSVWRWHARAVRGCIVRCDCDPIGHCPIACLADLPSAAQSAAEGHMLVGMHAMQCTARRSIQRTHSTIHNRLET